MTYLRIEGDTVVASYEFDDNESDSETIPLDLFLHLLDGWRRRVVEAGGVSGDRASALAREPALRPMPPAKP